MDVGMTGCLVLAQRPRRRVMGVESRSSDCAANLPSVTMASASQPELTLEETARRPRARRARVAVVGRTALHRVADVDVVAAQPIASIILVRAALPADEGTAWRSSSSPGASPRIRRAPITYAKTMLVRVAGAACRRALGSIR